MTNKRRVAPEHDGGACICSRTPKAAHSYKEKGGLRAYLKAEASGSKDRCGGFGSERKAPQVSRVSVVSEHIASNTCSGIDSVRIRLRNTMVFTFVVDDMGVILRISTESAAESASNSASPFNSSIGSESTTS